MVGPVSFQGGWPRISRHLLLPKVLHKVSQPPVWLRGKGQILSQTVWSGVLFAVSLQPGEQESSGPDLCLLAGVTAGQTQTGLWSKHHRMMFLWTPCNRSPPCTWCSQAAPGLRTRLEPPVLCPGAQTSVGHLVTSPPPPHCWGHR